MSSDVGLKPDLQQPKRRKAGEGWFLLKKKTLSSFAHLAPLREFLCHGSDKAGDRFEICPRQLPLLDTREGVVLDGERIAVELEACAVAFAGLAHARVLERVDAVLVAVGRDRELRAADAVLRARDTRVGHIEHHAAR